MRCGDGDARHAPISCTLRHEQIRPEIAHDPVLVGLDRTRLGQLLLNLVKNGADAMAGLEGRSPSLSVTVDRDEPSGTASCRVEDNGCGIPQDELGDIFEPYYTTKPPGRGTGLGLFVVKQILDASDGELSVTTREGAGSAFTFRISLALDAEVEPLPT